jgi:hypothetical protein
MLKLDLASDPRWIDLTSGVRVKVKPLTSALMLAARHDPRVQALAQDDETPDEDALTLEVTKVLAGLVIEDWEGVGDGSGQPAPVSQEWIDALLDLWPMFEAFQEKIVAGAMLVDAEKNV